MHQHVAPVVVELLALFLRFARHHGCADHDITEERSLPRRHKLGIAGRKCEHVGRLVLLTVFPVKRSHLMFIDDPYGDVDVAPRVRLVQGSSHSVPNGLACGHAGVVDSNLYVDVHRIRRVGLGKIIIVGLVGSDDSLHQRMPNDVLLRKERKADSLDIVEYSHGVIEAG